MLLHIYEDGSYGFVDHEGNPVVLPESVEALLINAMIHEEDI